MRDDSPVTLRVRLLALLGAAGAVAGIVVLLWPLHASDVRGNALAPKYVEFGFASYQAWPAHPTGNQLRAVGVPVPQDAVRHRRLAAAITEASGLALAGGAFGAYHLARRRTHPIPLSQNGWQR